jgi:hypothetical protein
MGQYTKPCIEANTCYRSELTHLVGKSNLRAFAFIPDQDPVIVSILSISQMGNSGLIKIHIETSRDDLDVF